MTVDANLIADLSDYTEGTDFTSSQFTRYLAQAQAEFSLDDPGISGDLADEAVGLLVCHRIYRLRTKGGEFSSEKSGDWSGTRAAGIGESTFMAEYRALTARAAQAARAVVPSRGTERSDKQMSRAFALTDHPLPSMRNTDPTIEKENQ